jgi:uracil-DNA glycosylase
MEDIIYKNVNNGWIEFFIENEELLNTILNQIDFGNNNICPTRELIFRSLEYFGPLDIKLLILGQDPYIGYEIINNNKVYQACGLSFSVPETHKKIPPSLKNIYKEIKNSYPEYNIPKNGSLERWCTNEKVLLLNASLTVIESKSNSHEEIWKEFKDKLIKYISDKNNNMIFLLMGKFAQKKN